MKPEYMPSSIQILVLLCPISILFVLPVLQMHHEEEKRKPFSVAFSLDHKIYMLINVIFNLQSFLLGKEY